MLPAGFGSDGSQSVNQCALEGLHRPFRGSHGDSSIVSLRPALDSGWAF